MSLSDALSDWHRRSDIVNQASRTLLDSLPEDPPRGSYDWWARVCRENTGQAICDSGLHYGYGYNRPVPSEKADPVVVGFHNGEFEGATVELIAWLEQILDAEDETASSLEQLLYWCGNWLHPRESWAGTIREFERDLDFVLDSMEDSGEVVVATESIEQVVRTFIGSVLFRHTDLQERQRDLSDGEYVSAAMGEFPADAVDALSRQEWVVGNGENTYNHENDFSQVFQWTEAKGEDDTYAIIQIHTGCDVRGGYTTPVVALVRDTDYFYSWNVDFWCRECDRHWEMPYFFSEALRKEEPDIKCEFALEVLASQGGRQVSFPGMEPEWPGKGMSLEDTLLLAELWRDVPGDDREVPDALVSVDAEDIAPEKGYKWYGAADTRLRCPDCGAYAVCASNHVAYGF